MKLALLIMLSLFVGCNRPREPSPKLLEPPYRLVGSARVPVDIRQRNYQNPRTKRGSCTHASAITMLRQQGQFKAAAWWRRTGSGGAAIIQTISRKCRELGIKYVYESKGDVTFLEWVSRTRRVAVINHGKYHTVNFAGFRNGKAIMIDNNQISDNRTVPKQAFIRWWQRYGGDAITILDLPPPPKPWR